MWTARIPSRPFVGPVDDDTAVEAAGPQQRGIEDVGPVGGGDEDDALVRLEPVHLDEQLVERLLAFVMPAAEARAAVTADRVDLVDDAGRVLLALLEEVAHAGGADADEHLDEVRTADREERDVRFARDGARQASCRFPGPHQEHALRDAAAELLELLRLFELDDFLELFFRLVNAATSLNVTFFSASSTTASRGSCQARRPCSPALHLPHDENPEPDHEEDRRQEYRSVAHGLVVAGLPLMLTFFSQSRLPSPSNCAGA